MVSLKSILYTGMYIVWMIEKFWNLTFTWRTKGLCNTFVNTAVNIWDLCKTVFYCEMCLFNCHKYCRNILKDLMSLITGKLKLTKVAWENCKHCVFSFPLLNLKLASLEKPARSTMSTIYSCIKVGPDMFCVDKVIMTIYWGEL